MSELEYCLDYLDLPPVDYNPWTEEGERYKTALKTLSQPCSFEEKALATLICILNREALFYVANICTLINLSDLFAWLGAVNFASSYYGKVVNVSPSLNEQ